MSMASSSSQANGGSNGPASPGMNWTLVIVAVVTLGAIYFFVRRKK